MKASYPLDELTIQEMRALIKRSNVSENQDIELLMNADSWGNYESKGFVILAYNEQDQLSGILSAIDLFGLNTYEWSVIVHPQYRRKGIGTSLVKGFINALDERGAVGDMALSFNNHEGHKFLQKIGYEYSSSEATLRAKAQLGTLSKDIHVRPFENQDADTLIQLMHNGFGDMPEETEELIAFNTTTLGRQIFIVEFNRQIVATVCLVENEKGIWVTAFTVEHSFRGQGIGTAILQWVKNYTVKKQRSTVLLDVEMDNLKALNVYINAGFSPLHQVDYFIPH